MHDTALGAQRRSLLIGHLQWQAFLGVVAGGLAAFVILAQAPGSFLDLSRLFALAIGTWWVLSALLSTVLVRVWSRSVLSVIGFNVLSLVLVPVLLIGTWLAVDEVEDARSARRYGETIGYGRITSWRKNRATMMIDGVFSSGFRGRVRFQTSDGTSSQEYRVERGQKLNFALGPIQREPGLYHGQLHVFFDGVEGQLYGGNSNSESLDARGVLRVPVYPRWVDERPDGG